MENHLTKLIILISSFILLITGVPPQIMRTDLLLPFRHLASAAVTYDPTHGITTNQYTQPTEILSDGMDETEKVLITTQPLGILTPIDWDNLDAVSIYPTFVQLSTVPPTMDARPLTVVLAQQSGDSSNSSKLNKYNIDGIGRVADFYARYTNYEELDFHCTACHTKVDIKNAATNIFDHGHFLQLQIYSELKIGCMECHSRQTDHIASQFHGLE